MQERAPAFNGLTAREWTLLSRNVWNDVSSPRQARHLAHGAVFPVKLAERLVRIYSAPGALVLDPFAGVGSTCIAAARLGRRSIGIELNPEFYGMAQQWVQDEPDCGGDWNPTLINGDCRHLAQWIAPESVQATITSPPYADFIARSVRDRQKTHKKSKIVLENNSRAKIYSGDSRDFGNLPYEQFLEQCKELFATLLTITARDGYAVWIVKDYRLPPETPYVPMHSDLAAAAQVAGWKWHDLIVWDQNEQRSLVLLGYPSRFYSNQNCSFIVVLRKP